MQYSILFESDHRKNYVGVLADSALVSGPIAAQNAGSSDSGLYYRVDGGGVNGHFATALGSLCPPVNKALAAAYDARFGDGAREQDDDLARGDRLTSFYIPIPPSRPDDCNVGTRVAGMVYSVGPKLHAVIVDRDQFRGVYVDALKAVAAANQAAHSGDRIAAVRLTLLSTGIYGGFFGDDETQARQAADLRNDVASIVLDALVEAARLPEASALPTTMLVNCGYSHGHSYEADAFTHAAAARGITADAKGFSLPVN